MPMLCASPPLLCVLRRPTGLHLQNTTSKIELLRTSGWQQQNIKPSFVSTWPCVNATSHTHEASPVRCVYLPCVAALYLTV